MKKDTLPTVATDSSSNVAPAAKLVRVLDMINTHDCARELLDHRVSLVNDTKRFENAIYCSPGKYVEVLRAKGHTVYVQDTPRNLSPFKLSVAIWKTFRLLRNERFDIVHTHTSVVGFIGRVAAFLARTPIVVHQVHGFHFHQGTQPFKRWIFVKVEKALALLSDRILFQNQADLDDCQRRRIAPTRKLVLIGNGVCLENFRTDRKANDHPPIILYVTRLEEVKNHPMLFQAAKLLRNRKVDFHIQLVGDGELRPTYEAWVRQHGLEQHISFLGYREDVPELIAKAKVCVLVSFKEGLPRSLLEAAASSRPTVATDVVGTRDALVEGQTGFLVPLGDAQTLANRLEQLLADPALCQRIGAQAKEYAQQHFDERVVTDRIIAVYDQLLETIDTPARNEDN